MTSLEEVLEQLAGFGARYVTVTGGEPLAQPACLPLLGAYAMRVIRCRLKPVAH